MNITDAVNTNDSTDNVVVHSGESTEQEVPISETAASLQEMDPWMARKMAEQQATNESTNKSTNEST